MFLYKIAERKDPRNSDGAGKFYAIKINQSTMDVGEIAKIIAERAGQTEGTVKGLLEDLFKAAVPHLQRGESVQLGDIGRIRLSLRGASANTEEELDTSYFTNLHIVFTPTVEMKESLSLDNDEVKLQQVTFNQAEEEGGE